MSIDSAHTYDSTIDLDASLFAGVKGSLKLVVAPFGAGAQSTLIDGSALVTGHYGHHFSVTASRASDTHYEYSFYFEYDFSTSSDPAVAGPASDVIIGGGVDIIVIEAIEGD